MPSVRARARHEQVYLTEYGAVDRKCSRLAGDEDFLLPVLAELDVPERLTKLREKAPDFNPGMNRIGA
jgi:hypothetical protein